MFLSCQVFRGETIFTLNHFGVRLSPLPPPLHACLCIQYTYLNHTGSPPPCALPFPLWRRGWGGDTSPRMNTRPPPPSSTVKSSIIFCKRVILLQKLVKDCRKSMKKGKRLQVLKIDFLNHTSC